MSKTHDIPRMSIAHSLGFWLLVALLTVAKGIIIRRPAMVAFAERFDLDARAVRYMERLHAVYEGRTVLARNPFRPQAIVLDAADLSRVLAATPDPFSPASDEKRSALGHFEPQTSLLTAGPERAERRELNEQALETGSAIHSHGERFRKIIEEEISLVLAQAETDGVLKWPAFAEGWFRIVRRIVLGDAARDDEELTRLLAGLRRRANWAFMVRRDRCGSERFHSHLSGYLRRAEPGSLAAIVQRSVRSSADAPTHQMAQWLFAFDPAGMTTLRTLALIASQPKLHSAAEAESKSRGDALRFLRACVLETLRLYPTTPAILRQATTAAHLGSGRLPSRSGIVIFAPYFHRMPRVQDADSFEPARWLDRDAEELPPFVPFSRGPAACPGKNLVPLLTAQALAALLAAARFEVLAPTWLTSGQPLRGTFDVYSTRLAIRRTRCGVASPEEVRSPMQS